jgi:hypothetical protein
MNNKPAIDILRRLMKCVGAEISACMVESECIRLNRAVGMLRNALIHLGDQTQPFIGYSTPTGEMNHGK